MYMPGFTFLPTSYHSLPKITFLFAYMWLYVSPTKMKSRDFVMFPDIHDPYPIPDTKQAFHK